MTDPMVHTEVALQTATGLLAPWGQSPTRPEPNRLDVVLPVTDLLPAVNALNDARWGYLSAITGLDLGLGARAIEVLYHFCAEAAVVTLRVRVSHAEAVVPSVCDMIPSASLFERELSEMFGVAVTGTPDSARLFLPDDWPEGVYPLRKDAAVSET